MNMSKYKVISKSAKIFDFSEDALSIKDSAGNTQYLKLGDVIEGTIIGSNKGFIGDGYVYASATVIQITYYDSNIEGHAHDSQYPHTGYSLISWRETSTGYPTSWFEAVEDESTTQTASAPSSSGTGVNDPVKNNPVVLDELQKELSETDKAYFSSDLYAEGIFAKTSASEVAGTLQKFGGASNVSMRLFGMPYQFMPSVDSRIDVLSKRVGTQFLYNIISEAAIVTITPGKPIYMGNYSGSVQTKTTYLIGAVQSLNNIAATQVDLKKQIKYYDFEEDYISYMHYVNMMCRSAAGFLGIDSAPVDSEISEVLARFDWKNYRFNGYGYDSIAGTALKALGDALTEAAKKVGSGVTAYCEKLSASLSSGKGLLESMADAWGTGTKTIADYDENHPNSPASVGVTSVVLGSENEDEENFMNAALNFLGINENFVQFMIEPNSFTETSSNETTQSQLLSTINDSLGSTIREVSFIGGSIGAQGILDMSESAAQSMLDALGTMGSSLGTNVIARVTGSMKQLMAGDRIIFPEIFSQSTYRKDYSLTIKLKSPYGDKYSYYINVLVPLFHLIALAAPKQTSGNTYDSPFLVRVFLPGQWQINMGIITDLSIERNGSDGLSVDGFPLELTVTMTIKDLYSDLMITPTTEPSLFLCNTGLVDFIMIQCGLDVTNKNYTAKLKNAVLDVANSYEDVFSNVADAVLHDASKSVTDFVSGILH